MGEDAISFKQYAVRFMQQSIIMVLADFTDLFIHCTSYFLHCTFKIQHLGSCILILFFFFTTKAAKVFFLVFQQCKDASLSKGFCSIGQIGYIFIILADFHDVTEFFILHPSSSIVRLKSKSRFQHLGSFLITLADFSNLADFRDVTEFFILHPSYI